MENRSVRNARISLLLSIVSHFTPLQQPRNFYGSREGKLISSQLRSGLTCCFCNLVKKKWWRCKCENKCFIDAASSLFGVFYWLWNEQQPSPWSSINREHHCPDVIEFLFAFTNFISIKCCETGHATKKTEAFWAHLKLCSHISDHSGVPHVHPREREGKHVPASEAEINLLASNWKWDEK